MITIKHPVDFPVTYPLERIGALKELLFFDIETTGFSGDTAQLYLIGCVYHDGFGWKLIQWFADCRHAEKDVLEAFFDFLSRFRILVHFNGDGFDIPYLLKCCRRLGISGNFDHVKSIDIYKKIKPLRKFFGLESMKQKSIERFLGITRTDVYSGGELIEVYYDYLHTGKKELYDLLILHNEDDLKGMPAILPILSYPDLLETPFSLTSRELCETDNKRFLHLVWHSPCRVPVSIEYDSAPVSLELGGDALTCNVELYEGELKYFYSNYKDYYYLPMEDTAIHKSVGEYVDKSARKKATAKTCYTRKSGLFLPQFSPLWTPAFKENYQSDICYTLFDENLFSDAPKADAYARQLLAYAGGIHLGGGGVTVA